MSSPKFSRIVQTLVDRLQVIEQGAGYYTDIGARILLNMRPPQVDELPCCMLFAGERTVESVAGCQTRVDMDITVIGYDSHNDADALTIGDRLQSDIQRAVELEDASLGGLLRRQYGLAFQSSELFLPEIGTNAVGARVTYSAPHIRLTGDPEIKED